MCTFSLAGLLFVSSLLHPGLVRVGLGFQHFKGPFSISSKVHAGINAFSKVALLENRLAGINSLPFSRCRYDIAVHFEDRNIYHCVSPTFSQGETSDPSGNCSGQRYH